MRQWRLLGGDGHFLGGDGPFAQYKNVPMAAAGGVRFIHVYMNISLCFWSCTAVEYTLRFLE